MYRIVVIGCGKIGAGMGRFSAALEPWSHAGVFHDHETTELAALVDSDEAQLAACKTHFPGIPTFTSVADAIHSTKPDLVVVATGTGSHAPIVKELAGLGVKTILCEKPLADSESASREMIQLCKEKGILLLVNHIRRFDPVIQEAKKRLPEIGEILQLSGHYSLGVRHNGVHLYDLMRFFAGDVKDVIGLRNEKTETKTATVKDIDVDGLFTFNSGARGTIQAHDGADFGMFTLEIFGRTGSIHIDQHGFTTELRTIQESADFIGYMELTPRGKNVTGIPRNWMRSMADHVVAVLDGKETPLATGEDGLKAVLIGEALKQSAEQGGTRITIPNA